MYSKRTFRPFYLDPVKKWGYWSFINTTCKYKDRDDRAYFGLRKPGGITDISYNLYLWLETYLFELLGHIWYMFGFIRFLNHYFY